MITLHDVNKLRPETQDGDLYRNLFKDINGHYPFGAECQFRNIDEFDIKYGELNDELKLIMGNDAESDTPEYEPDEEDEINLHDEAGVIFFADDDNY